jgi:NitT/TauT family transport system substrate-binding protein
MKKSIYLGLVAIFVVATGYFTYNEQSQPLKEQQPLANITITQAFENFLYAPLYVAEEQGFFAAEGIEINLTTAGGDEKAFAGLLSSDAQFAVGDPTFAAIAGQRGQSGLVIASILNGVPCWGLAKDPSIETIENPAALAGYSVATFPAPSTAYVLQQNMFQQGGLTPDIKQTAPGALLATLDSKQADIALELEPNVSTAVQNGYRIVYSLNDYHPEFAITGLMALPSYVEANPEITQGVVNALQNAMEHIRQNPNQVADFLATKFPSVPSAVATDAVQNMITADVFPQDTIVSQEGWDAAIQARLDAGDLTEAAPYETYVTTIFSDQAK